MLQKAVAFQAFFFPRDDDITVGIYAIIFIRVYGGSWREALIIAGLGEFFVITVFDWLLKVFWPVPYLFEPFIKGWY